MVKVKVRVMVMVRVKVKVKVKVKVMVMTPEEYLKRPYHYVFTKFGVKTKAQALLPKLEEYKEVEE